MTPSSSNRLEFLDRLIKLMQLRQTAARRYHLPGEHEQESHGGGGEHQEKPIGSGGKIHLTNEQLDKKFGKRGTKNKVPPGTQFGSILAIKLKSGGLVMGQVTPHENWAKGGKDTGKLILTTSKGERIEIDRGMKYVPAIGENAVGGLWQHDPDKKGGDIERSWRLTRAVAEHAEQAIAKEYHLPGQHEQQSHAGGASDNRDRDSKDRYNHAEAVATDPHAIAHVSLTPGQRKQPWQMSQQEYESLPVVYRGGKVGTGFMFVTQDRRLAEIHGQGRITAFKVLPSSKVFADPEIEGEQDRALNGLESLKIASAVVHANDLIPNFSYGAWKHESGKRYHLPGEHDQEAHGNRDGASEDKPGGKADVTRTPEFKKWFSGSKVVDAKGEPLVVYHGTFRGNNFEEFRSTKFPGVAGYFSTSPELASLAAEPMFRSEEENANPHVIPAYLSLKNPLDATSLGGDPGGHINSYTFREIISKLGLKAKEHEITDVDEFRWEGRKNPVWSALATPQFIEIVKRNGYDGVKFHDVQLPEYVSGPTVEYVAFASNQVKSKFNRGTFDPKDPRISYDRSSNQVHVCANGNGYRLALMGFDFTERSYHLPGEHDQESHAGDDKPSSRISKRREFSGSPVHTRTRWTKLETGERGESIAINYLRKLGFKDARKFEFSGRNNLPVDLIHDHEIYEVKAGMIYNQPDAQKWRLTLGQPGKKETEWLHKARDSERAAWNKRKAQLVIKRKRELVQKLSKELGRPVKLKTLTMVINPDTQRADLHVFDGTHPIIRWRSPEAQKAYVGTIKF
jgi:hypothetical protein